MARITAAAYDGDNFPSCRLSSPRYFSLKEKIEVALFKMNLTQFEPMGRIRLFFQSLAAGQVFLLCNVAYSLASVPLALSYLPVVEFGLWAIVMQVANFLLLLDAGFSSGAGRLLIDVKDGRPNLQYGRLFLATLAILLAAAIAVIVIGITLTPNLILWMRIPVELCNTAASLTAGQILISACSIPSRIVGGCLTAYGRIDLLNSTFTVSMLASLAAMWVSLHQGAGAYSLLWASGAGTICTVLISLAAAWSYGYLPSSQELTQPKKSDFKEVLLFSQNIFLNQIGGMVLNLSQSVLLGRFAGLETVGTWSVGSKMFTLIQQSADKLAQSAGPICSEMWARNETARFSLRIAHLKRLSFATASVGAAVIIAFNSEFISVWTRGKILWNPTYNYLLAALFAIRVINTADSLPILASKLYGLYRFVPLVEAFCFVFAAAFLIPAAGITGLLVASIAAALLVTTPYLVSREWIRIAAEKRERTNSLGLIVAGCLPSLAAVSATRGLDGYQNIWIRVFVSALAVALFALPLMSMTWKSMKR